MDTILGTITRRRSVATIRTVVLSGAMLAAVATSAFATDQIFFSATTNVSDQLAARINAERVRIDISAWYLTDRTVTAALINRFKAGVPVRLIGDRGSIFEIDAVTRNEFYWLASQGLPIRLRYNPTWYPEIDHWKATIFVGQNLVAFGSGNYTPFELAPWSSTNYKDEIFLFTDDPAIVGAFKTKFDRIWNDTTPEPQSLVASPPYLKNWNEACALESACSDYKTQYPSPAAMQINTARLEPDYPLPPDIIWGQGAEFNNRLVQEINAETTAVNLVSYRLTVDNVTNALLAKYRSGVPTRLIMEPAEYLNRMWPEFWLTHANVDKLWAAGMPIKQRAHDGLTHMKVLVTSRFATVASSNIAASWQRDHNYFLSAAAKPAAYQAIAARVTTMWNDTVGFTNFKPLPPDAPALSAPAFSAAGTATTPTLVWGRAAFAVSYDVYLGTTQGALSRAANVPAQLVNDPPTTYSWTPGTPLQGGTTYYWKVVSRTNATPIDPTMVAASPTWTFTTVATSPPPPPPASNLPAPWATSDVGAVGLAGSASYSAPTFTVTGAGADIWGGADAFRYAYQSLTGDGQIVARVASEQNTSSAAKAGVMLRETLAAGSVHVILDVLPGGGVEFMSRRTTDGATTYLGSTSVGFPAWLRLTRSGTTVTAFVSANGTAWTTVGSTSLAMRTTAMYGLAVTSHNASLLNRSTFDSVTVSGGTVAPPPPPTPSARDIVVYASDVPASARHGSWTTAADATSPNGVKLVTADAGVANTANALPSPSDYVDVTFTASAGTPYTIWLRLRALNNSKYNDAVWLQFSDAVAGGSAAYRLNTTAGLLVNLATDGTGDSLSGWGWQNAAYWMTQQVTVSFAAGGTHTLRIQIREDGVQLDQIVLSPTTYLTRAPGPVSNDATIVPKP